VGRRHAWVALPIVLAVSLMAAGCDGDATVPAGPLLAAITAGHAPPILDVRTTKEYAAGHVPGAIHVPYHLVWLRRADLPADKAQPIVVYCSHGPRAAMAVSQLWTLGYGNVSYLEGQMSGWKRLGLPLEALPRPPGPYPPPRSVDPAHPPAEQK